ncbi:hypothetical protein T459_14091 [Capsicum annuum]|uniref:Uncharacterized protein n=1 Tax=Capsicum annuum TaxID=4072 RepID=A0A2G2ZGF5_CAPAN|nr:hypothetical protein T459_14091 [Capsicum annuum]
MPYVYQPCRRSRLQWPQIWLDNPRQWSSAGASPGILQQTLIPFYENGSAPTTQSAPNPPVVYFEKATYTILRHLYPNKKNWVISPEFVYIKKLVHSWRHFDPELLSDKDIFDEFTLRLGLSQVKQLLVTGPSNCEHSIDSCVDFGLSKGEEYDYEGLEAISKERGRVGLVDVVDKVLPEAHHRLKSNRDGELDEVRTRKDEWSQSRKGTQMTKSQCKRLLQVKIVGEEDDLEQIQVATQDFEPYGLDVGNEEDFPRRPMVYPEFESWVEKLMTRGVPTGTDVVLEYGGVNAIVVSATKDETCKVWSLSKKKLLRNIMFPTIINSIALDFGEDVFYAGGRDGKIYIATLNIVADPNTHYGLHILWFQKK